MHTWAPSTIRFTPVEHSQIRGLGPTAWFGWYKDEEIEVLTRRFVEASTQEERDTMVLEIHRRAFSMVPCIPLGTFQIRTAYRSIEVPCVGCLDLWLAELSSDRRDGRRNIRGCGGQPGAHSP